MMCVTNSPHYTHDTVVKSPDNYENGQSRIKWPQGGGHPCLTVWVVCQRIRATVNTQEQKRLLMDLDISMRTVDCFYTVTFYGALFREVAAAP